MPRREPNDLLRGIDYTDAGTAQRVLLLMCLDTSHSMQGEPIRLLNEALADWAGTLRRDISLAATAEIAVVTFGAGGVVVWRGARALPRRADETPFVPAAQFQPPVLQAAGVTPMTEAIEVSITLVETRKLQLRGSYLQYHRPLIWLVTDGLPTDAQGQYSQDWKRLPPVLDQAQEAKKFRFFAVGVGSMDDTGKAVLSGLSPNDNFTLGGFPFHELLPMLSASIEQTASGNEDFDPIDYFQEKA
jgi:uncharacterized protein YegL